MNVSIRIMRLVVWIGCAFVSSMLSPTASVAGDAVGTNFGILVGFPTQKEAASGGTLLVPGTVIPLTANPAHEDSPRRQIVEKSLSFAQAAERLWSTFRLDPARQQQQAAYDLLTAGKILELPSVKEAGVRISATLMRSDGQTATYRIVFRQGEKVLADSTVPVARGGRAVVGGMDGTAAPYIFVFVEPDAAGTAKEPADRTPEGLGVTAPVLTRRVLPVYPEEARQDKATGVVVLQLLIGTDGKVHEVEVLQDPDPRLTKAAMEAVRQWEFEPAHDKEGKPLSVKSSVTLNFALK